MVDPIANGIIIPKHTIIYVKNPAGPLMARGAVSAIYFGQKTEYEPAAIP